MTKILTNKDDKKIPKGVIFIGNKHGWIWLYDHNGKWLMNHTHEKGNKKWFHEKLVYTTIKQIELATKDWATLPDADPEGVPISSL